MGAYTPSLRRKAPHEDQCSELGDICSSHPHDENRSRMHLEMASTSGRSLCTEGGTSKVTLLQAITLLEPLQIPKLLDQRRNACMSMPRILVRIASRDGEEEEVAAKDD